MDIGRISNIEKALHPGRSGGQRDTYFATARRLQVRKELAVYFKLFNLKDTDKGIFNELLGFYTARAFGLPVSSDTFICLCDRGKIKGPARCLQGRDPGEKYIRGIASVDLNPHKIKQLHNDLPRYEVELLNWPQITQVAVYDELMMNVDRTIYNLVRLNKFDYGIIDHEEILGGVAWSMDQLETNMQKPSPCNHLANLIASIDNEFISRRMVQIAQDCIKRIELSKDIIDTDIDLESFCRLEDGTLEHIFFLLKQRIKHLPEFIYQHIQSEQLFHGQS